MLPPGAWDLHVHTAPDVVARSLDDADLVEGLAVAGMAGAVLKSHVAPTAGRAWHASRLRPEVAVAGSVTLNRSIGGLNAEAVEALARLPAALRSIVWMPTRDAANDIRRKGRAGSLPVALWDDGRPLPALREVLEVVAAHDLILASGHLDPDEALALFALAQEAGCRRMVATHVTAPITPFGRERAREAVALGAVLEICARNLLAQSPVAAVLLDKLAQALDLIRATPQDAVFLSSDLGDIRYPPPTEGLAAVSTALRTAGVAERQIEAMLVASPARLLGT